MSISLELLIHPMCPFAQRALYTMSYKQLSCSIREVDLEVKPPWFLEVNPKGILPALRVKIGSQEYHLHESLVISEYFDSFPGPFLYPRHVNGQTNYIEKALIDLLISSTVEPLRKQIGILYFNRDTNPSDLKMFQDVIHRVDQAVSGGKFFLNGVVNRDDILFADLMALPLIERILAFDDQNLPIYKNIRMESIRMWHSRIRAMQFVKGYEVAKHRIVNLRKQMQDGKYHGLRLPVEYYDNYPKI